MDDGAYPLPALLMENAAQVVVGLPPVDDKRLARLRGEANMLAEAVPLLVARRMVVMVVESCLADRRNAGVGGQPS